MKEGTGIGVYYQSSFTESSQSVSRSVTLPVCQSASQPAKESSIGQGNDFIQQSVGGRLSNWSRDQQAKPLAILRYGSKNIQTRGNLNVDSKRSRRARRWGGGQFLPSFLPLERALLCSASTRTRQPREFFLKFLCALISLKVGSVSVGLGQLRPPGCCWLVVLLWWMSRFVWPEFQKKNWLYDISWDNVGGEQCPDWTGDIIQSLSH